MEERAGSVDHCGLEPHQVHPCAELFKDLRDKMLEEDFLQMKILSKDKLGPVDVDAVTDWNQFFGILQKNFNDWEDLLKFLKNVASHTDHHVGPASERLLDVIQRYQKKFQMEIERMRKYGISKDENFIGRNEEISQIYDFLKTQTNQIHGVCICGLAGMGKTSVATEVCYRFKQTSNISVIKRSLRGKRTIEDFYSSILSGLSELSLADDQESQAYNPTVHSAGLLRNAVFQKLKSVQKDVILFLDNLDDILGQNFQNTFRELLSITTDKQVKLLITCRQKLAGSDDEPGESVFTKRLDGSVLEVTLKGLSKDDGKTLLKCFAGDIDNIEARQIVQLCGQCPLVIKIMGNHLRNSPDIRPVDVIRRLQSSTSSFGETRIKECFDEMFQALSPICRRTLIELSVFETSFEWSMATAVINKPEEQAEDLVRQLRCHHLLEVESEDILEESVNVDLSRHLFSETGEEDEDDFVSNVRNHQENRLLGRVLKRQRTIVTDPKAFSYSFHPTVLRFLQQKSKEDVDAYGEIKAMAEKRFCKYFYNHISANLGSQLDRNSVSACTYIQEKSVHLGLFFELLDAKRYDLQARNSQEVQCLFRLAKVRSYVGTRFRQSDFYHTLAEQKGEQGDELFVFYARIQELICEQILDNVRGVKKLRANLKTMLPRIEVWRDCCDEFKNLALADYYGLMGRAALDDAKYKEDIVTARPVLREAVDLFKTAQKFYKKEKAYAWTELAQATNCIGSAHFQLEEYDTSKRYHQEALDQMERRLGKGIHGDIPNYLVNIGTVYHALATHKTEGDEAQKGLYHKALEYYRKATEVDKKLGFPDDLVEARRLRNMADIYRRLNDFTEAYRSANKSFRIFQRHFQPPHVELTTTLHAMGHIQYCKGKLLKEAAHNALTDEAEKAFKKAEDIYDDVTHMMKYGGLSRKHQDYYYVRTTHEKVMEALRDQTALKKVRIFYRDLEAGKYDKKIDNVQRQIAGESSGSDMEEEEEEEEAELGDIGAGAAGGGGAVNRQDSGFDGSIDYDLAQLHPDFEGFSSDEEVAEEVFH